MLARTEAYGLTLLYPKNDAAVGKSLAAYGEFARSEVDLIADYLRLAEPGAVVDVGANLGAISLPVAKQFPDFRFIGIEGHIGLAQVFGTNAFVNDLWNVQAVHAVAGASAGVVMFPAVSLNTAGNLGAIGIHMVDQGVRSGPVRMCVLDEVAPIDTRLIKIDVEGYEPDVLRGAGRALHETRPVWLIETSPGTEAKARETIRIMLAAKYDVYWMFAPFVSRSPARGGRPEGPTSGDYNIVAVPRGGPNPWDLQPVESGTDAFPRGLQSFPYLTRYGF